MIIDSHTHQIPVDNTVTAIVNLSLPAEKVSCYDNIYFSAGIHPWQLNDLTADEISFQLEQIETLVRSGHICFIGECGIDRNIPVLFEKQVMVFEQQLALAEKFQLPMIIHCVRAYSDLIAIAKSHSLSIPWVIHGFNGNPQQIKQLSKYDKFYFSFGQAIIKYPDKFISLMKLTPQTKLLLETDDSDTNIMDIYRQAAKLLDCSYDQMKEQVKKNVTASLLRRNNIYEK